MSEKKGQEHKDSWEPFRYFLGEWRGNGSGAPGFSQSERHYSTIFDDRFIKVNNRSVYEPQERNPKGEIHEDLGLISYDKFRDQYVLREFHIEGYVNQYVLQSWDRDEGVLIMDTEAIENIPPGWRARTTYKIISENKFREIFDLAGPEDDWSCYITTDFERQSSD